MELMKDFRNERPLILAVDDDRTVLDEVMTVLSGVNLACHCCATSEEAFAAARKNPPDLILCNVNLHGESGLELCERIRRQPGRENVPVMFLCGMQLPDVIRRNDSGGGAYCLRKPFDSAVLVELIDQALGVPEGS